MAVSRQPRVVLLSFNLRPHERVVALAERLLAEGARVDLLVISDKNWADFADRANLRILALNGEEKRHPVLRMERILVTRGRRRCSTGWAGSAATAPPAARCAAWPKDTSGCPGRSTAGSS